MRKYYIKPRMHGYFFNRASDNKKVNKDYVLYCIDDIHGYNIIQSFELRKDCLQLKKQLEQKE